MGEARRGQRGGQRTYVAGESGGCSYEDTACGYQSMSASINFVTRDRCE